MLDSYTLIVHGEGWFGTPGGNTGTGTVKIEVRDLNNDVHTQDKDTVRDWTKPSTVTLNIKIKLNIVLHQFHFSGLSTVVKGRKSLLYLLCHKQSPLSILKDVSNL